MVKSIAWAALGLMAAQPGWSGAQAKDTPQAGPLIVVYGPSEKADRSLVDSLTATRPGEQIARWNDGLCVEVGGVRNHRAQYIEDRIGSIARGVGIHVIDGRCTENVFVHFSKSADFLARRITERHPALYRDTDKYGLPTKTELSAFLKSRPVRWIALQESRVENLIPSRIAKTSKESKVYTYVLVDSAKVTELNWQQLAAYLSVVVLSSPRMVDGYDKNTIMSLFNPALSRSERPEDLTRSDRSLLQAYYGYDQFLSGEMQRAYIARRMGARGGKP